MKVLDMHGHDAYKCVTPYVSFDKVMGAYRYFLYSDLSAVSPVAVFDNPSDASYALNTLRMTRAEESVLPGENTFRWDVIEKYFAQVEMG